MKKLLVIAVLLAGCFCFDATPQLIEQTLGMTAQNAAAATIAVTSTAWMDILWYESTGHNITHVFVYVSAITGTPLAADQTLEFQGDTSGSPSGSAVSGCSMTTATTVAASTWLDFAPAGTCTLSSDTQYHIVVKNATGATTTTYRQFQSVWPAFAAGTKSGYGCQTTANSGGSWSVCTAGNVPAFRMDRSDSTYRGWPFESIGNSSATLPTAGKVFGVGKYWGFQFTSPANAKPNVTGVSCIIGKVGSPTGTLSGALYTNDGTSVTLLASAANTFSVNGINTTAAAARFRFSSTQTLTANSGYIFAITNSAADSSTNYYFITLLGATNNTDTNALMPFNGTYRGFGCSSSCTGASSTANWTTDYNVPLCALTLDTTGEFASTGTGGQSTHASAH